MKKAIIISLIFLSACHQNTVLNPNLIWFIDYKDVYTNDVTKIGFSKFRVTDGFNYSYFDDSSFMYKIGDTLHGKKIKKVSPNDGKQVPKKPEVDILRIFVPAGTTGGSVSQISMNAQHEAEILLPRGLDITISPTPHIVEQAGYRILVWNARVVGHNPQPVEVVQKD